MGALRVYVESDESVQETPVLVVVRHEKGVLSWQFPLLLQVKERLLIYPSCFLFWESIAMVRLPCVIQNLIMAGTSIKLRLSVYSF